MKQFALTFFLYFALSLIHSNCFANIILSQDVSEKIRKDSKANIIIYFKERARLQSAESILDRGSRITSVYKQLTHTALKSQKNILQFLKIANVRFQSFYIENAIAVFNVNSSLLQTLTQFSEIQTIALNVEAPLLLPQMPDQSTQGIESHLFTIGVDRVWKDLNIRGKGIVVAGQDTGYFWQHNSLKKQYRGFNNGSVDHNYNWHNAIHTQGTATCAANQNSPCDDTGHGTHTMGSMVGDDGQKNQIGVAPEAKWMGCRNMHNGVGSVSTYLECFEFFLAPYPFGGDPKVDGRPDLAPHIVNNSWSCPKSEGCKSNEFLETIKAFKAAGILVVVAAGNSGPNCGTISTPPGNYAGDLISVGAYNPYGNDIAFFSGLGPASPWGQLAPNLTAPGAIRSAVHTGVNDYDDKMGTSMASPLVAGVAALLWSARPELIGQVELTMDVLQKTATPLLGKTSCPGFPANKVPNAVFGYGMVNAYDAIVKN